jgi:hypothetical protein
MGQSKLETQRALEADTGQTAAEGEALCKRAVGEEQKMDMVAPSQRNGRSHPLLLNSLNKYFSNERRLWFRS